VVDDGLGLRTRDEHARVDGEGEPPEPPLAEDVPERLSPRAPLHQLTEAAKLGLVQLVLACVELGTLDAEHMRKQPFRVDERRGAAGLLERLSRLDERVANRHIAAAASRARRRSSEFRASVKSSSSPSSTPSSLCRVTLTRWSVTRFSGKL
jgi:hypothetical protein